MKALHQIIDYLREYGHLAPDQLDALVQRGVYPAYRLYADRDGNELAADGVEASVAGSDADDDDAHGETAAAGRAASRAGHGGSGRLPSLTERELAVRLGRRALSWRPHLAALMRVGRRLSRCDGWADAAVVVRNADADALIAAVASELSDAGGGVAGLWRAVDLEDYHDVLRSDDRFGPAVNAFKALLRCGDHASLGQYAWLLRTDAIADVFNLKLAQRRLLRAWGVVFDEHPELTAAALRRVDHGAYWSFVLLYSARRPNGVSTERPPPRQPPAPGEWMRYWARAVAMEPTAATSYLVDREETLYARPLMLVNLVASALQAYPRNDRVLLQRFYRYYQSPPQIAAWAGRAENDVHAALARFRGDVLNRLTRHPHLRLFHRAELATRWQGFLGEFLYELWTRDHAELAEDDLTPERRAAMTDLVATHFGAAYDLLCPINWD